MTESYSFSIKPEQLVAVQTIVKAHHMRFVNNPAKFWYCPSILVTVEAEDNDDFNAGRADIDALMDMSKNKNIKEPKKSFWRSVLEILGFYE
jgi:hypothetical protein